MVTLSVLIAILFVGLVSLLLIMLALMHETVLLRGEVQALTSLITRPPAPTFLGKRVPEALARRLPPRVDGPTGDPIVAVLFFNQDCEGCRALAEDVRKALFQGRFSSEHLWVVVESFDDDDPIMLLARSISAVVIHDSDGAIRAACQVLGTPTLFIIRSDTLQLVDHELGGDAARISRQFSKHRSGREAGARLLPNLQSAVEVSSVS